MSDGNGALPEGWAEAKGDDLFEFVRGVSYKKSEAFYEPTQDSVAVLRAGNLQDGRVILEDLVHVPPEKVRDDQRLSKGDLVIAMSSGSASIVGKVAVVTEDMPRVAFGAFCGLMRPRSECVQHWLGEYFQTLDYRNFISDIAAGVNINNLRRQHLQELSIRVPPPSEMDRLESKIESLQERSSRARRALSEVGPLLEQFRQSVLAAAFSGRLTADWRAARRMGPLSRPSGDTASADGDHSGQGAQATEYESGSELLSRIRTERRQRWEQSELAKYEAKGKQPPKNWQDKYQEPQPLSNDELAGLPSLPDGWCWSRFANFCTVQGGFAFKSKDYTDTGTPLIRIGDLDEGAVTIDDSTARLPPAFAEQHLQFQLNAGDVLIAMSGATTGKMAVFDSDEVALLNQRVGRFLPHAPDLIHGPYLRGLVESIVEDIRSQAYGGAQPNISPTEIAATPVAFPPLEEQVRIADLLSEARVSGSSVESECAESKSALTQLDQSILAKAFRGELVPQDPRDEPASELLARIRTTRQANAAKPKKKPARRKAES